MKLNLIFILLLINFSCKSALSSNNNQKTVTNKSNILDINLRYPPYERLSKLINMIFKV